MIPKLGKLVSLPITDVFANEPQSFTPWLAQEENLSFLAEALQLGEVELEDTEVPVGNFRLDILARGRDGAAVVIENQFGSTDHKHLGQLLTYLAGQEGPANVIWIAARVNEEHRAAIDWLNAHTSSDFNFFAVEVEVLRIGESEPAPWFNVVAKPNSWSRNAKAAVRQASEGATRPRHELLLRYWTAFEAFLKTSGSKLPMTGPSKRAYYSFRIGRSGFAISSTASVQFDRIGTELYINHPASKAAFRALNAQKAEIEEEVGATLDWQELPDAHACRIAVFRSGMDPDEEETWPEQFQWLGDFAERFHKAFASRVKQLDLTSGDED